MALSFAEDLKAKCDRALKEVDKRIQHIAFTCFTSVVIATPIEKGALCNNWFPGTGVDFSSETTAILSKEGSGSKSRIYAMLDKGTFYKKDSALTLTNNLDYAYKIEYEGWSHSKAPEGMVRVSVVKTAALFK